MKCLYCSQFQQFDYSQQGGGYGAPQKGYYDPMSSPSAYTGTIMTPDAPATAYQEAEGFEDEPPLMEGGTLLLISVFVIPTETLGNLNSNSF